MSPTISIRLEPGLQRSRERVAPALRAKLRACIDGLEPWPVFLHGPPGTGKSCAALAIADQCPGAWYAGCRDYVDLWRRVVLGQAFTSSGYEFFAGDFWRTVEAAELAILDELGDREHVSATHYDAVKGFLDKRQGKPTIVVSNLGPDRIEEIYDGRVRSRLCSGTVVDCQGRDRRLAR